MIQLAITILLSLAGIVVSVFALFAISALYGLRFPVVKDKGESNGRIPVTAPASSGTSRDSALKAILLCSHIPPSIGKRFKTIGYADCRTMHRLFGGNIACSSGCLGLGNCARACPSDAIVLRDGQIYVSDACNGCALCVDACPKKLIKMVPVTLTDPYECAAKAVSRGETKIECPTAHDDYAIDLRIFPESGFKLLNRWGILRAKSR